MPAGKVSLTLYQNESVVCSTTVTYYTEMEEICMCLKKAMDPMQFMCQVMMKLKNNQLKQKKTELHKLK